ncbi:hypothetical protein GALMADRAFT_260049 [Galerina marginata CBS 339.88]|uniref:Uncharacterized protein n=1 Tax=Galerina marginata (strain CBS 339.88) TaxID=685588 RepID=A0A067SGF6_GALM3|nr:hypothetical protein GALMADRAFT_260049 [Galerina marginata CBS 339.88]
MSASGSHTPIGTPPMGSPYFGAHGPNSSEHLHPHHAYAYHSHPHHPSRRSVLVLNFEFAVGEHTELRTSLLTPVSTT